MSNAFASKLKTYREKYSQLSHVKGKPFVICIGAYDQPYFFLQKDNAMRRVLHGLDQPLWIGQGDGRMIVGESLKSKEKKDTGAEIEFGYFARPGCEEVSAVIFSSTATYGKVRALAKNPHHDITFISDRYNESGSDPLHTVAKSAEYEKTLCDGMHVYLNPFAAHSLDPTPFQRSDVAVHFFDPESRTFDCDVSHGHLFARVCHHYRKGLGEIFDPSESVTDKKKSPHASRRWAEGELVPVEGNLLSFTDNHFAHYKGWTIVVVRDSIDNDWGWQTHRGSARSIPEYMKLNASHEGKAMLIARETWFPTKEQAFEDALTVVDREVDS